MTTDTLFPTTQVARALRVSERSVQDWVRTKKIAPDEIRLPRGDMLFSPATVDAFIASCAHNFGRRKPPTFLSLLYDREKLLLSDAVSEQLGIGTSAVNWRATKQKSLPVLRFGRKAQRFPARQVARIASAVEEAVHADVAAHILGVPVRGVINAVAAGKLQYAPITSPQTYFTRASFMDYLTDRLAESGMPPHIWWQERIIHPEPLVPLEVASRRLHCGDEFLVTLMQEGRLPFIRSLGGIRLIPEHHVATLELWRRRLTTAEIAQLFATEDAKAERWRRTRVLCKHSEVSLYCPRKTCVLEYIRANSFGIDPEQWWQERFHDGQAPLSVEQVVDMLVGSDRTTVLAYINDHTFRWIALPKQRGEPQDYRIHSAEVRAVQRTWSRRLGGGDYHMHLDEVSSK